jgi:hypothetical protein
VRGGDPGDLERGEGPDQPRVETVPVVRAHTRRALARGIPVLYALTDETDDLAAGVERSVSRSDDLFWSRFVTRSFTWPRFLEWWVHRRWVQPRDVRKT